MWAMLLKHVSYFEEFVGKISYMSLKYTFASKDLLISTFILIPDCL